MLELDGFNYLARLKTFYTYGDVLRDTVHERPYVLQVGKEPTDGYARYLLADAAL